MPHSFGHRAARFARAGLFVLGVLTLVGCDPAEPDSKLANVPTIVIGDGTGVNGTDVLRAASDLNTHQAVVIRFHDPNGNPLEIQVMSDLGIKNLIGDHMFIMLSENQVVMNDEPLDAESMRSRLKKYTETARKLGAVPLLVFGVEEGTTGPRLVAVFRDLIDCGMETILAWNE